MAWRGGGGQVPLDTVLVKRKRVKRVFLWPNLGGICPLVSWRSPQAQRTQSEVNKVVEPNIKGIGKHCVQLIRSKLDVLTCYRNIWLNVKMNQRTKKYALTLSFNQAWFNSSKSENVNYHLRLFCRNYYLRW